MRKFKSNFQFQESKTSSSDKSEIDFLGAISLRLEIWSKNVSFVDLL